MLLALIVIITFPLLLVFLWSYRTKNVQLSEQKLKAQPTPEAVFEAVVRRWFRFNWNFQLLVDYNSPSHTGGRLTLTARQLTLYDARGQIVFQLPADDTLKIILFDTPARTWVWVYADGKKYQIRLLQDRNIFKQLKPYRDLEQGLVKVRGEGYSNT